MRAETVGLARDYIRCSDELTTINSVLAGKIDMMKNLKERVAAIEDGRRDTPPDDASGETAIDRLEWATNILEEFLRCGTRLLQETQNSMEAVSFPPPTPCPLSKRPAHLRPPSRPQFSQLRSIEQNELNILSDRQNRALLTLTIVTMIFLPLSFFSSYFGMNLRGLAVNERGEAYFWEVCGSLTLVIIVLALLLAFWRLLRPRSLKSQLRSNLV
jgi:Mg2+ and Co2+ transporter CorA